MAFCNVLETNVLRWRFFYLPPAALFTFVKEITRIDKRRTGKPSWTCCHACLSARQFFVKWL